MADEEARPWKREAQSVILLYCKREHAVGVAGNVHQPSRF